MPSATRWRINITDNNGSANLGFCEMQMRITSGGSDQCSGGTPSASDYTTGYEASKAFDNSIYTMWQKQGSTAEWLEYEFASSKNIVEYTVQADFAASVNQCPKDWTFEYYDGADWVVVDVRTGETGWSLEEVRTYTLTQSDSTARITQFAVEILTSELSKARTTQFVVEALEKVTTTTTETSSSTTTTAPTLARITHALAEVLRDGDPDARITHVVAEVLRGSYFRDLTNIAYHGAYPEVAYAGGELPRLFDSNPATFWMGTNSDDEGWVKFMFPEKEIVNAYQITARNDGYYQQTPGTWTFEASNTGAFGGEEVTLDSQSSVTWSQGQSRYYTFSNTTRYKFYRLNVTWTETTANLSCAELRIGDTNFTESTSSFSSFGSDVSSGETYSASSEYSGQYDHLAIDDTYNTFWAANNEMPCWWQIQFASQTQINKITIQARHDSYYYQAPVSFEVLASDTGSFGGEEVTLLSAQDCCENWAVSEIRTFIFANSTSYYYYRIDITDSGDGNNGAFAEIELMEGTSATTSTSSSTTASTTSTFSTTSSSSTTTTEPPCDWNDDFTGDNNDPPDRGKWEDNEALTSDDPAYIYSNKLQADIASGSPVNYVGTDSKGIFDGDFDVWCDVAIPGGDPGSSLSAVQLRATFGPANTYVWVSMHDTYTSGMLWSFGRYVLGASSFTTDSRSTWYGQVRLRRSGTTMYGYWRLTDEDSWTLLTSHTNSNFAGNAVIGLYAYNGIDSYPGFTATWDNFWVEANCPENTPTTTTSSTSSTISTTSTMSSTSTLSTTSSTSSTASSSSTSSTASSSSTTTTPPPEYWHTDFREATVDAVPSGWTEQWHPTSGVSTIRGDGSLGSNCLEIVCTDERYGLSWDQVGQQDDAEILVKVRARANVDVVGYAILRGSGTGDGAEQAYYACLYASSDRVYIRKYVAGSSQTITYYTMTVDTNTWYWMRFRILGDDLKLRVWEDGDAEPGTWQLEVTDTDISGDGWVGVGTFYNGPDYDYISVASNGGTALLPSATTTTSTVTSTTSTTHTYTGSTTTMSSTSSTASTTSTFSTTSSTMSSTSTQSTTSSSSSSTTTTFPPCFWNDDFTQDDGAPSRLKWTDDSSGTGYITVESNRLHVINGGGGTNTGTATCNATFSGDFTVEVDLEAVLAPFENSWSARLQALIDSSNYIWVDMHFEEATDSWTVGYRKAAPEKYPDSVSRTNDYGSLRIVRTGSVFYTYYKDGTGSWTEINSGGQNIGSGDVTISFDCVSWEFAANFEIAWDNFLVDYWGCPESVTTTTSSTTSSSTTTVTESTTSSTATSTSSTASTTSTFSTTSSTASTTSTFSTTSSTVSTVSTSSTTFSFTTTTFSGTTTTAPPPPDTQTTTMVVVTTG